MRQGLTLWMLLLVMAASCSSERDAVAPPEQASPNVVLVMIDALRRDHLGLYGYPRPTSPFLDTLGAQGIVFDNAYSQAPQTFNSTATLFTSRMFPLMVFPRQISPNFSLYSIAESNLTLAEVMREHGYDTFGVFTNPHHYAGSGFIQGFDDSFHLAYSEHAGQRKGDARGVVDAFLGWLGDRSGGPFLAYLHFMDVHYPYKPPPRFRKIFAGGPGRVVYVNGPAEGKFVPTEDDLAFAKAMYDGEILFVDEQLARLVAELRSQGLWGNTIVIVTSDHGDEFMEHGGLGHGFSLEKEMVSIPLLLSAGDRDLGGPRRVEALARNLDIAPTILEIAGIPAQDAFEGRSLLSIFDKAGADDEAHSFAWHDSHRSITNLRWHFVMSSETNAVRLYDNRQDPAGLHDVADSHPKVVDAFSRLAERYEKRLREMQRTAHEFEAASPPRSSVPSEIVDQLEALGYVE